MLNGGLVPFLSGFMQILAFTFRKELTANNENHIFKAMVICKTASTLLFGLKAIIWSLEKSSLNET